MCSTLADGTSARSTSTSHTGGTHEEPKGVASLVVTNQCFWCGSTHASIETTTKHMAAAAARHGFTILSSTVLLTPSAHVVTSSVTTQQNYSAILLPWNICLARVIISDQCRNLCRCQWKRSQAKDPRQMESKTGRKGDENTSNRSLEGRRKDDVAMGSTSSGQKGSAKDANNTTDAKLHNAVLKTDALRALSASEGSQRRSLHVLDDQARGARVQETERAIARLTRNWRRPRERVTASVLQG